MMRRLVVWTLSAWLWFVPTWMAKASVSLPFPGPGLAVSGVSGPTLTYIGTTTYTGANTSPITLTGVNIGIPVSTRLVIISATAATSGLAASAFASCTIGGITGTIVVQVASIGTPTMICSAIVPTGTTATISISNTTGPMGAAIVSVYTMTGYVSATATSTTNNHSTASPLTTGSYTVPANGVSLGAHAAWAPNVNITVAGVTTDNQTINSTGFNPMTSWHINSAGAQNVSGSWTGTTSVATAVAAAWN